MGSSGVTAWATILKTFGKLVKASEDTTIHPGTDVYAAVAQQVALAVVLPPLPHAAWKKVVLELKVSAAPGPCPWPSIFTLASAGVVVGRDQRQQQPAVAAAAAMLTSQASGFSTVPLACWWCSKGSTAGRFQILWLCCKGQPTPLQHCTKLH